MRAIAHVRYSHSSAHAGARLVAQTAPTRGRSHAMGARIRQPCLGRGRRRPAPRADTTSAAASPLEARGGNRAWTATSRRRWLAYLRSEHRDLEGGVHRGAWHSDTEPPPNLGVVEGPPGAAHRAIRRQDEPHGDPTASPIVGDFVGTTTSASDHAVSVLVDDLLPSCTVVVRSQASDNCAPREVLTALPSTTTPATSPPGGTGKFCSSSFTSPAAKRRRSCPTPKGVSAPGRPRLLFFGEPKPLPRLGVAPIDRAR